MRTDLLSQNDKKLVPPPHNTQKAIAKSAGVSTGQVGKADQKRIKDDANRARSEAAKEQPRTEDGTRLAEKPQVREHSVHIPDKQSKQPERKAKAKAAKVNPGAVAIFDTRHRVNGTDHRPSRNAIQKIITDPGR